MKRKYEVTSAVFFILAIIYWCFLSFVVFYLTVHLHLANHPSTMLACMLWILGTAVLIAFGIVFLFKSKRRSDPVTTPQTPQTPQANQYIPVPESVRLARLTEKLKAGEMNQIPGIYTFLTSADPDIVRTAATTLANYVDTMDPKYLVGFDAQFRSHTSMEWSIDWEKVDISRMESVIGNEKTFLWVMRLGTFNPNGYYREKCINRLVKDPGSYIFLLIRLKDWVAEVRAAARKACNDIVSLSFYELVNCLSSLEKVKRSERADAFFLKDLESRLSERIVLLSPGFEKRYLKGFDVPTRRALYRILLENKRLGKDEVKGILASENNSQCLYYVMSLYIDRYGLTAEELDEFIDHKSFTVQRKAIEQKYDLTSNPWPGLESKLLSPSTPIRELVRYILKKHNNFDCRAFYIEHLDSSDKCVCIAGIGETGKAEDAELIMPFLENADTRIVKAALHALANLGGDSLKDVFWKYLQDDRQNVAIQAFREITRLGLRYGAKQIYDLFCKTDSQLLKIKLIYRLSHEAYWDRVPYALMLYYDSDYKIRDTVRIALAWKHTNAYSGTTKENAAFIRKILNNGRYKIDEDLKTRILFNLEHTVIK